MGMRGRLDELNGITLGVFYVEPAAAVAGLHDGRGNFDALRFEISAETFSIGGLVAEVVEAVMGAFIGERQHLYKLSAVDVVAHALGIFRIGAFFAANDVNVIMLRGCCVRCVNSNMRDASERRTRG